MTNKAVEWFLVKVLRKSKNEVGQASVQKLDATNAEIAKLVGGKTDAFVIDDNLAKVVTPAPAISTVPAAANPQAQAGNASQGSTSAWAGMPGGWATLAASSGADALAAHGNYPLHDSVARVAAGKIITTGASTSYASMPGGWVSLGNSTGAPAAAPAAASAATPSPIAATAASAASAPAPAAPPEASVTPAHNESTSGGAAWAGMPGGWATLAATIGSASAATHGNYPLHDGIARVAAGKIMPAGSHMSWAAMPGGWASLHRDV